VTGAPHHTHCVRMIRHEDLGEGSVMTTGSQAECEAYVLAYSVHPHCSAFVEPYIDPWWEAFQVGDAYGSGFEMRDEAFAEANNDGLTYRPHGLGPPHEAGQTTDDTQMAAAVWDVVYRNETDGMWTPTLMDFSQAFCDEFAFAPAAGYGSRMQGWLRALATEKGVGGRGLIFASRQGIYGKEWGFTEDRLRDSCGACMRAIPCGFASSAENVVAYATTQARVTHHHPDSIDAAVLIGLAAYDPDRLDDACDFVDWQRGDAWHPSEWKRQSTSGKMIALAAMGLLHRHQSLHELLIESVKLGGDVDTLAALTLGIGALDPGRWKNDLPDALRTGLRRYTPSPA